MGLLLFPGSFPEFLVPVGAVVGGRVDVVVVFGAGADVPVVRGAGFRPDEAEEAEALPVFDVPF